MNYPTTRNSSKLVLSLKDNQIRINLDEYTADKSFDLFEKCAAIRIKNSPHAKFPRESGESDEEWRNRIKEEAEKDQIRRKGEKSEDYLKRIFDARHDQYTLCYEFLNAICEVFGMPASEVAGKKVWITEAVFKTANWMSTKKFIYDVLSLGDVPISDLAPDDSILTK